MRFSTPATTGLTTSRTGERAGRPAGRRGSRGPRGARRATGRRSPAFTVIELLIVIGIIAILASILIPALLATRTSARKRQAEKEVLDIVGALTSYYLDRNEYPPDTADWAEWHGQYEEDLVDVRSLHRYLGKVVKDEKEREYGPYLIVKFDRLKDVEDDVGKYLDPWGNAYQIDVVHTKVVNDTPTRVSAPYREDTSVPEDQRTLDFKVVSVGPDKETGTYYPFDPDPANTEGVKWAADDIRSW